MPRSKSGKTRDAVDSERMKNALIAVTAMDENKISLREACKVYNVKLTTLSRQLKMFRQLGPEQYSYKSNFDIHKVFSEEEEELLVDYILKISKMNYGLSKKGVRQLAFKYAVANGKSIPETWKDGKIAGEQWMRHFMQRHSNGPRALSIRKPEPTSLSRSTSFNKSNVDSFFDNIEDVHKRFGPILPHRVWNLDETGLSTVQNPPCIVAPKGAKQVGSCTSAERGNLVTIIVAVNAIGNHIPPLFIFPRVFFKDRMLIGAPSGSIGGAAPSGWSNEQLFLKFLDHFVSHVKSSKEERILLVLDNHETHLSVEALEKASEAGIVMVTFPPHTSHKLQPLDLTVYGPLKTYYNQGVDEWHINNPGVTFDIYRVAQVVGKVFSKALSTQNITSGFESAGIYPLNRHKFTDDDFLSSYVTDRPELNVLVQSASPATEFRQDEHRPTGFPIQTCLLGPQASTSNEVDNQIPLPQILISTPQPANYSVGKVLTPEEIQPFPKAGPRKVVNRGRKPGKTRIVTDTPEKEKIKQAKLNKDVKQKQKKLKTVKKINFEEGRKKKPHRYGRPIPKQKKRDSSSSDDDLCVPLVETDNEDSADEECIFCNEPYFLDKCGEQWIRCLNCKRWAHELCSGIEGKGWKTYICDFCTNK